MANALKHIELAIRRRVTGLLSGSREAVRVTEPADVLHLPDNARILLLRQDRIGDVLVSIPVIRALRNRLPFATIDMVLSPNNLAVRHALAAYTDDVHVYRKSLSDVVGLLKALRRKRYDLVIDLMDNPSTTSSMLVRWSGARMALGIEKANSGVYTHVVPLADRSSVHIVERLARLLMPFGIDPSTEQLDLEYRVTDEERRKALSILGLHDDGRIRLGVNISGSDISRMYGEEAMTEVLTTIRQRHPGVDPYIFAAPPHKDMQMRIAASTGAVAVPIVPSFHEYACLLSVMDAIVTPDTSSVHLAAAWKTPSVVLFMHDDPALMPWYPYMSPCRPLEAQQGSISDIPREHVISAIDDMLRDFSILRP